LGEVCEFAYGKGLKESDRIEGEFDVFGSNGVVGSHSSFLVEHPFIVVGRKGSAGAVHYSTKNGFPIDTTFYISKKELNKSNISLPFLFYTLTSLGLDKTSSQQTVPGLNRNDAYRMKIPLPDLQIQEEIVRKIMDEQSLVSNNKKLIEIYTQKIQDRISNVWGG
jgi:type I restriction enzyme S subunit